MKQFIVVENVGTLMLNIAASDPLLLASILYPGAFFLGVVVARRFAWPMVFVASIMLILLMLGILHYPFEKVSTWLHIAGALTTLQVGYAISALFSRCGDSN